MYYARRKNCFLATRQWSIFCKVSREITIIPRWVAVENPGYKSKGLIVFLDRKPDFKEKVEIIRIGKNFAVGKVVS